MVKKYLLSTVAALALGFAVSCDNTTDDPPGQDKNGSGSGTTITGPRILSKVTSGTKDIEEYITTVGGALNQSFIRDVASTDELSSTITYTGDKITTIKYVDNKSVHVVNNTYNLTYTNNKLTGITLDQVVGVTNHSDFSVIYDANGQLYRIVEKKKLGGSTAYTHYVEYKFTFSASNVVKMDYITMLMSGGNPDPSTSSTMTYAYENYDSKINPYTTLPKEYCMVTGTLFPINFNAISTNNVGKVTIQNPVGPAISYPKTYAYDSQNYPISDQAQIKYTYKPL